MTEEKTELEKRIQELLKKESKESTFEKLVENEINWVKGDFWDSWDKIKGFWHNIIKLSSKETLDINESPKIDKWFFLAHSKDYLEGKPQLVHNVMQNIPMIRLTSKINKEGYGKNKTEWKTPKYVFLDERYDKRYDGAMISTFSLNFWVYRIIYKGKEYYIYSQEKLPDGKCSLKGMLINLADVSEMSNTLKVNSLSHLFIVKEAESAVKTLQKEELVSFVKNKKLNLMSWNSHLSTHEFGSINNFPIEMELLKSSFLLSSKVDGWPMHLAILGPPGTRKTMGHGETTYSKFDEETVMASSTSYRLKGLIPSFKKSPAEPGYILKCHRIAIIDEIGKLIDAEANRHDRLAFNILGEFNDILEHKHRSGGSGNDFIDINPTAKVFLISNPPSNRNILSSLVGLLDGTTMSRILWWVQDPKEQEMVLGPNGLIRNPPHTSLSPQDTSESSPYTMLSLHKKLSEIENREKEIVLKKFRGDYISKEEFLTIYDSCNSFVCEIDDTRIEALANEVLAIAKEPMKSTVWRPRSYHTIKLLIDGLCKTRCLFDDYDSSFKATNLDYDWAERILVRMVKSWDTDMAPKEDVKW